MQKLFLIAFLVLVFPQGFKFEQINSGFWFFGFFCLLIFNNVLLLGFNSAYFEIIFCGGEKHSQESRGQEI